MSLNVAIIKGRIASLAQVNLQSQKLCFGPRRKTGGTLGKLGSYQMPETVLVVTLFMNLDHKMLYLAARAFKLVVGAGWPLPKRVPSIMEPIRI